MTPDGPDSRAFVTATLVKTGAVGAACAVGLGLLISPRFGLSVAAGAGVAGTNFAAIAAIGRRMFERSAGRDEDDQRPYVWTGLLAGKMMLLLVIAAVLVVWFGVDPIGFAVGFTIFVVAATWSALQTAGRPDAAG